VASVSPNPAHHAIARAEEQLGDRFLLVTQNVDGLHTAAGSQRVIEIHGNLRRTRCHGCSLASFADTSLHLEGAIPRCDECGGMLRPDIVWFGEMIPPAALFGIQRFFQSAAGGDLVFLAAGTSGLVYPAAGLVNEAKRKGGTTYLANMDRPENASAFDHVALGPASKVLPELLGVC
jgi:NAD-dependent deacetylase